MDNAKFDLISARMEIILETFFFAVSLIYSITIVTLWRKGTHWIYLRNFFNNFINIILAQVLSYGKIWSLQMATFLS